MRCQCSRRRSGCTERVMVRSARCTGGRLRHRTIGMGWWARIFNTEDGRGPRWATEDHLNHKAAQAVGEFGCVEVEYHTDGNATHPQVCEQLSFMDRQEGHDGFYFANDLTCYDDVRPGRCKGRERRPAARMEYRATAVRNRGIPRTPIRAGLARCNDALRLPTQ